ncbi:MAG: ABC transporter permease [Candidatus Kapaibacteriota bacterium]|jgi:ABC-2 type transport system permease protein
MIRIISFVVKELIQLRRDKIMLGVVLFSPIIQLVLLGYAANMDVKIIKTTILDYDRSTLSRRYVQSLISSGYFKIHRYAENYAEANKDIETGKSLLFLVFPKDFGRKVTTGMTAKIQVVLDASNGNKTSIVFGYLANANSNFNNYSIKTFKTNNQLVSQANSLIEPEIRVWYNPEMVTRKFLLPGIVALLLLIVAVPLTAMGIVKEKENGTIEQIMISPSKSYEIIAGKLIPFQLIGFLDFTFVLLVMVFWFGVGIKGSVLFLFFAGFLFTTANLGLGLLISTFSRNQQQAMILSVFGVIVPMIYLSGFVFPVENMPKLIQYVTFLFPLKYFLVILRGIVLKGVGIDVVVPEVVALLFFGIVFFLISTIKFKKMLI